MMRSLPSAMRAMRRSPYQAILAILMMSLSFFVATSFLFILFIANRALQFIETRPQVVAYFAIKATDEQIQSAQSAMSQKSYVSAVHLVSKQDALKIFQQENKKDPLLSELVTADILPASLEISAVSVDSLQRISEDVQKLSGVEDVVYQKDIIQNLSRWTKVLRQTGLGVVLVLFGITLLLIVVILSLRVAVKRKEIGILNLLGASRWYIRGPFVVEGVLYGVFGALFGWLTSFTFLLYATSAIVHFFGTIPVLPLAPIVLLGTLGGGLLVGFFLGLCSSYLAVARFIRH